MSQPMIEKTADWPLAAAFRLHRLALTLIAVGCASACAGPAPIEPGWVLDPSLVPQTSGTSALLIAVSPVDRDTVWVSGALGTWARTIDGGETWISGVVPGADSLQFRDVHARDARTAWLLSIGNGDQSRIYHTSDAGATWSLQFTNTDPNAFYDCFDFWDDRSGIAFSDSHDSAFSIIVTGDGRTWARIPPDRLPPASPGEGGFASSGTCLVAQGDSSVWIGTGASDGAARVLRSDDRGRTWSAFTTPIVKGQAAGITTLAVRDAQSAVALGGDIGSANSVTDNVAITSDGAITWTLAARTPFAGAVYGSAIVPAAPSPSLVAVGPAGLAFSTDNAASWMPLDTLAHWGVAFASPDAGWAVGPAGRITRITLFRRAAS
jgi:photosystem II stability/assembly factor-like uncharacterized protein